MLLPIGVMIAASPAWAEPTVFHAEVAVEHPGTAGQLGDEMETSAAGFRWGFGIRSGSIDAAALVEMMKVHSHRPERDNGDLFGVGAGVDARLLLPGQRRWEPYLTVGWRYRWLLGDTPVIRSCDAVGGCDGGFWTETPGYGAHGLAVAIGVQRTFRHCDGYGAVFTELRGERLFLDLPGTPDVGGGLVMLAAGVSAGWRRNACISGD